eukprot:TRINITY_DN46519_c0_g1_i2.p1 TRINITY_DN46519_c0_g1~~TRINITY_DN46519_c0_g1_i2.p1  ORF type:complete len:777 (+),score=491.56 TRINITY_DN46519_c0_g1_i2:123-2453(+)
MLRCAARLPLAAVRRAGVRRSRVSSSALRALSTLSSSSKLPRGSSRRTATKTAAKTSSMKHSSSFATKTSMPVSELPEPLQGLASRVFNDAIMRRVLEPETYQAFRRCQASGQPMSKAHANSLALAMQRWAMGHGCVNYAHWFSALRGSNAEKHDGFVDIDYSNGEMLVTFSGSKLFMGESDGSSFPHGGTRATHRAAAYTAWDVTSPPFIRGDTLYIPSVFVTWRGDPIDEKTPLLRSQDAINNEAVRLLRALGDEKTKRVVANVGWEQEFFVVDHDLFLQRQDLVSTGRTLLGAQPHKGQQTDGNYFGRIPLRTRAFLKDVQTKMWKLGISFHCLHNEVAPSQHEVSPIFTLTNVAADQNVVAMEVLHEVAAKHDLAVLMHEKPFAGLNGSGKHNNWGLNTDAGTNLFVPGKTVDEQRRFITLVAALARTLDLHGDLLRIGISSAGNDHRLGAQEAPPAIMSLYTGEILEAHLRKVVDGGPLEGYGQAVSELDVGTPAVVPLGDVPVEDRNRTAPFPFCGNRFEFRAVGSDQNISFPLALLNTAMAESMGILATEIEGGKSQREAVCDMLKKHFRVIFNGDGYSKEWVEEADRRGLWHLPTTVDAVTVFDSEKNRKLFRDMNVFDESALLARQVILFEQYYTQLQMEASTLLEMLTTGVIPVLLEDQVSSTLAAASTSSKVIHNFLAKKEKLVESIVAETEKLEELFNAWPSDAGDREQAVYACDTIKPQMEAVRELVDQAERKVPSDMWPFPSYDTLLYYHHAQTGEEVVKNN